MKKTYTVLFCVLLLFALCACGGGGSAGSGGETTASGAPADRDVSFEGTELTVKLPTNKETGYEWRSKIDGDCIGVSINRSFKPDLKAGGTSGTSSIGFAGKSEGSAVITLYTDVGWDGTGVGDAYQVDVTVNADGTIASAEGKDVENPMAAETAAAAGSYTGFAYRLLDYYMETNDPKPTLTLEEDGTGYMTIGEDGGPVTEWSVEDGIITVVSGGQTMTGPIADGIIELDFGVGIIACYAAEGVDISGYDLLTGDEMAELAQTDEALMDLLVQASGGA